MRWVSLLVLLVAASASGQPPPQESARVLGAKEHELALFQPSRFGLGHDLQLESRLVLFGLMPNVALRWRALQRGEWHGALRAQLTYPGLLVRAVSREGAGGLLPPDTEPIETVMIDLRYLQSYVTEHVDATLGVGVEVAPRGRDAGNQAILDFPWLYPRFGALHRSAVLRVEASIVGRLPHGFGLGADLTTFALLGEGGGWSVELGGVLRHQPTEHVIVELGFRVARSRLPVGDRWHWLPTLDLRFPFDRG